MPIMQQNGKHFCGDEVKRTVLLKENQLIRLLDSILVLKAGFISRASVQEYQDIQSIGGYILPKFNIRSNGLLRYSSSALRAIFFEYAATRAAMFVYPINTI